MISNPDCVSVVLEQEFGDRVLNLLRDGPVWMTNTPTNRAAAENVWNQRPPLTELEGVTVFNFSPGSTSEETLIVEMDTIDLHHGVHSADPPYTV